MKLSFPASAAVLLATALAIPGQYLELGCSSAIANHWQSTIVSRKMRKTAPRVVARRSTPSLGPPRPSRYPPTLEGISLCLTDQAATFRRACPGPAPTLPPRPQALWIAVLRYPLRPLTPSLDQPTAHYRRLVRLTEPSLGLEAQPARVPVLRSRPSQSP